MGNPWTVIASPTDPEMFAVKGVYLVADNLPIEDARLIVESENMAMALKNLVNNVGGTLGYAELELRMAIGNTNYRIIKDAVAAADAILARIKDPTP